MFTQAIASGITYLQSQQQDDGSFVSFSSPHRFNFQKAHSFHSPFATALILSSLITLEETPVLKIIKQKAAHFLLKQKSDYWSFNYWAKGSKEAKEKPYPDDLDDTFCSLSALYQYNPSLIDGKAMAKIVMLLTATEEKEGGPYRTWLVKDEAPTVWKDIDVAVNSNIAYFLSLQDIQLPNLHIFIESRIKNDLSSPYYPTVFPLIYFISRFYKGNKREQLIKMLANKRNSRKFNDPLSSALRISAILNLNGFPYNVEKSISDLLHIQTRGFWKASGFCIDPARQGKTFYAGSSALTTAFCLEAISKYLKVTQPKLNTKRAYDMKAKKIRKRVLAHVNKRFSLLPKEVSDQAETILAMTAKMDEKNQITLLPYFFALSLGKHNKSLSEKLLILLGAANTYGWIAYTIYDNFWDEEGDPKTLAIANIALRELTKIFNGILPDGSGFHELFQSTMDDIEWSNTWEVINCRIKLSNKYVDLKSFNLPNFGDHKLLAQKSLGHALGPAVILFLLGYKNNTPQIKNLLAFFTHYLIARQLNDDAHDWQKDFTMGHITPVVVLLLKMYQKNTSRKNAKLLFSTLTPKLQDVFWHETIIEVCNIIQTHVRLARRHLHALTIMADQQVFEALLSSLEHAASEALDEREKTIAFIDTYSQKEKR
ncbi:MAG: hypothetical protein HYT11_04110 [Candidatus Levybacteria bacterium]|nr:hypothetical protein [Candidatus Levybacteria bacterium]